MNSYVVQQDNGFSDTVCDGWEVTVGMGCSTVHYLDLA